MGTLTQLFLLVLLLTTSLLVSASPHRDTEKEAEARAQIAELLSQIETKQELQAKELKFGAKVTIQGHESKQTELSERQDQDNREISDQNPIWDTMGYKERDKGPTDVENQRNDISDQNSVWDNMGYRAQRPDKNELKRVNLQAAEQQEDENNNVSDQDPLWDVMGYLDKARRLINNGHHRQGDVSDQDPLWDVMGYIDTALRKYEGTLDVRALKEAVYKRLQEMLKNKEHSVQASIQRQYFKRDATNADKENALETITENLSHLEMAVVQGFVDHILRIWHLQRQALATEQGSSVQELEDTREKDIEALKAKMTEFLARLENEEVKANGLPKFTDPGFFHLWERE